MSKYFPALQGAFVERLPNEESLIDASDNLKISLLAEGGRKIIVSFDDFLAYRKIDEGDAFQTLSEIAASSELGHLLYRVEDSNFIEWFIIENQFVRSKEEMKHFCLTTSNSVIDVICFKAPELQ